MPVKLGVIGGGVMGEALLSCLISSQMYAPDSILVADLSHERRQLLAEQYGIKTTHSNREVVTAAEVVILSVKPQVFDSVARDVSKVVRETPPLVISILAGVSIARLEAAMPGWPVVRAMPNTPATVGCGMSALAVGNRSLEEHVVLAQQIFQTVGEVVQVAEPLLDGVTGLSGSGPAYVAIMIEALADGGVAAGLSRSTANLLALQTVLGTAQLLRKTGMHPAVLKDKVTSPGGTTISGIACLEELGMRSAIIEAVRAASSRSRELGNG